MEHARAQRATAIKTPKVHKEEPGERQDSRRTGGSRVDKREVDKGDGAGCTKWNWVDRMELAG